MDETSMVKYVWKTSCPDLESYPEAFHYNLPGAVKIQSAICAATSLRVFGKW